MNNILFISNDPNIFVEGSAARLRMRAYADALAKQGGILHILSRAKITQNSTDGPLVLHGVNVGKLNALTVLPKLAKEIIGSEEIDVVSAQDPFEHGWIACKAVEGTSAKLHIQIHTDFLSPWFTRSRMYHSPTVHMPLLNRIRVRMAGKTLLSAQGIRVVSERIQSSITEHYGSQVVTSSVIPIAVSQDVFEAVPLPPHNFTFALLAVGRLEPEKRIEDSIAAVVRLKDVYPSLGLLIVGEGRERKRLERIVRRERLTKRVLFLGARTDARGLMRSAQAFIQTSAYEGYGLTLIEAALARVPIITSDVGIVGEVFKGYEHVLSTPVGDPTNFAAHIAWLIEDHEARKELVLSAERRAKEHLAQTDSSPEAVIADMLKTI